MQSYDTVLLPVESKMIVSNHTVVDKLCRHRIAALSSIMIESGSLSLFLSFFLSFFLARLVASEESLLPSLYSV
jgi:hypothetical protein